MNRRGRKWVKTKGVKIEAEEAKAFDKAFAELHKDFNAFLFEGGRGSFLEFDMRYRALALQPWRFIQPDPNDFAKFAVIQFDCRNLIVDYGH